MNECGSLGTLQQRHRRLARVNAVATKQKVRNGLVHGVDSGDEKESPAKSDNSAKLIELTSIKRATHNSRGRESARRFLC